MIPAALLTLCTTAGATPRAVGSVGGALPVDGVVRVAFDGVPQSVVTVDDGVVDAPLPLLEVRCTTAKRRETELCAFGFPPDVPLGVLALQADALSTTVEVGSAVDIGTWDGSVELASAEVSQRTDPDIGAVVVDLDSVWDMPAAPAAGYVLEVRDEFGRAVDWRTVPVDGPALVPVATASEVLVTHGEICLQAAVFDPMDLEVWRGGQICADMPGQPDATRRLCGVTSARAGVLPALLGLALVARRRRRAGPGGSTRRVVAHGTGSGASSEA